MEFLGVHVTHVKEVQSSLLCRASHIENLKGQPNVLIGEKHILKKCYIVTATSSNLSRSTPSSMFDYTKNLIVAWKLPVLLANKNLSLKENTNENTFYQWRFPICKNTNNINAIVLNSVLLLVIIACSEWFRFDQITIYSISCGEKHLTVHIHGNWSTEKKTSDWIFHLFVSVHEKWK